MLNVYTVVRLVNMIGATFSNRLTKEQLLDINKQLNKIPKKTIKMRYWI